MPSSDLILPRHDDAWHANRKTGIGGSDAGKIMNGQWLELWLEKSGRREPINLDDNLAVQIGIHTEELNLNWFERQLGHEVTQRGAEMRHPYYHFMRCELDGMVVVNGRKAVVQAKWCNPFSKIEDIEQRYIPQVMHEMLVCGCDLAFLSVITGNPSWECVEIRRDADYAATLLQLEEDFWSWVEADTPPPDRDSVAVPVRPAEYRKVDMTPSNSWAEHAGIWRETIAASRMCEKSAKALRAMVKPDVSSAVGHGVAIKRSRDGRNLYLKEI